MIKLCLDHLNYLKDFLAHGGERKMAATLHLFDWTTESHLVSCPLHSSGSCIT